MVFALRHRGVRAVYSLTAAQISVPIRVTCATDRVAGRSGRVAGAGGLGRLRGRSGGGTLMRQAQIVIATASARIITALSAPVRQARVCTRVASTVETA